MHMLQRLLEDAKQKYETEERSLILIALSLGTRIEAAEALGIGLRTLYYKIKKHGLDRYLQELESSPQ